MGENTGIEWCDHTFNPWLGCTKISPACDHCYAETWSQRFPANRKLWSGERRRTSESNWKQPLKWNRQAERLGLRKRVFCASLADVFDNQASAAWRDDLWRLIWGTPALDWLLLTKRPQNIAKMLPNHTGRPWPFPNVWLGTTAENQEQLHIRGRALRSVPAVVRFLSCEPLLGPLMVRQREAPGGPPGRIHWVICGGESGPGAREMDPAWARQLRDDCLDSGTAFFMKQMTRKAPIPDDLMCRQFPHPAVATAPIG